MCISCGSLATLVLLPFQENCWNAFGITDSLIKCPSLHTHRTGNRMWSHHVPLIPLEVGVLSPTGPNTETCRALWKKSPKLRCKWQHCHISHHPLYHYLTGVTIWAPWAHYSCVFFEGGKGCSKCKGWIELEAVRRAHFGKMISIQMWGMEERQASQVPAEEFTKSLEILAR